jgi:hypothetical protein
MQLIGNVVLGLALAALRGQMTLHQLANVRLASVMRIRRSWPLGCAHPSEAVFTFA